MTVRFSKIDRSYHGIGKVPRRRGIPQQPLLPAFPGKTMITDFHTSWRLIWISRTTLSKTYYMTGTMVKQQLHRLPTERIMDVARMPG